MKELELTCIGCPMGCLLKVTQEEDGTVSKVEGNTCLNGKKYAESEVTRPQRTLTYSVRVKGGECRMCSVKTSAPIPKDRVLSSARLLDHVEVEAPVDIGAIIVHNLDNLGVDVIATRKVERT